MVLQTWEKPRLSIGQILMNEVQHDGALADTVGYAAHRSITNVTDGEDSGNICLEQKGIALQLPAGGTFAIAGQIRPRHEKPFGIAANHSIEPFGMWLGSNKDEERTSLPPLGRVGVKVMNGDGVQATVAADLSNFAICNDGDVFRLLYAFVEIERHGTRQGVSAHQHGYRTGYFSEMDSSLAGGISPTHNKDVFVLAGGRFGGGGTVVNTSAG